MASGQAWWLALQPTQADAGSTVTVAVTDFAGEPVTGVPLEVAGPDGVLIPLRTGAQGFAEFLADRAGDWRVATRDTDLKLRAMLPIRPETPPGTGLWLVPALLLGALAAWRLVRRNKRRDRGTGGGDQASAFST